MILNLFNIEVPLLTKHTLLLFTGGSVGELKVLFLETVGFLT